MKKRILPLLLLVLPFVYLVAFNFALKERADVNSKMLVYLIIWVVLFVVLFAINIIFVALRVAHGGESRYFLFWNMVLKLVHIPVYLVIFFIGLLFASLPGAILFAPFLIAFDCMLLLLTSIYGIGGLVRARREKKITTLYAVVLGVFHFIFCADVICAIVAYCMVKNKDKKASSLLSQEEAM